jgi:DNA-binding IclR family transcriptional regulator
MNRVVKSAQRVMEIFEFFAERRMRSNINDVCKALGYPQSSTSMLLHSLVQLGYLTYDKQARTFHPMLRIATVGRWLLDEASDGVSHLHVMEKVSRATGHTIVLGVQNGIDVLYIQVIQATNPIRFYMKPGSLWPIHSTAVGQVLLSLKSDSEIRAIIRRINSERDPNGDRVNIDEVLKAVRTIRSNGYAMTIGTATPGAAVIARALPPLPDQPPMVIGIGLPTTDSHSEPLYAEVLRNEIEGT